MFENLDLTKLIFGRLTWDAIPFHDPIIRPRVIRTKRNEHEQVS